MKRWLLPSLADFVFCALLIWLVLFTAGDSGVGLLQDSNTGYHIRTGDYILAHRAIPAEDVFSFVRTGRRWYAWEWLSAVLFASVVTALGMKGLIVLSAAVIATTYLVLLRHMAARGANILVCILALHFGIGASSIHFLARPHIFTLLFLAISLWILDRDRREPGRAVWLLVPMSALWVNLHGGFIALIATLGIVAAGYAAAGDWQRARRYAALCAVCTLASAINPYGFAEHAHVISYLRQKWLVAIVQEFQSPTFHSSESIYFETLLVAGLFLAAQRLRQRDIPSALLILAWAHAALTSLRHIPVYVLVCLPGLAAEATVLWDRLAANAGPRSIVATIAAIARDHAPGLRRTSLWGPLLAGLLLCFDFGLPWPSDFPAAKFPRALIASHADLLAGARPFSTDSWADYLTFHYYPRQKIFVDGRSDYFGQAICEEYMRTLNGRYGWDAVMAKYGFDVALVPSESAIASLLKQQRDWRVVADDGFAILFRRVIP